MKSMLQWGCALGSALATVFLLGGNAQAQNTSSGIVWDADAGIASGSGCTSENTEFLAVDDELTILMDGMQVNLPAGRGTQANYCSVAVPVRLPRMTAITKLEQILKWGYVKDLGTSGAVSANSSLCGKRAARVSGSVGTNVEGIEPYLEAYGSDVDLIMPSATDSNCSFASSISVSGRNGPLTLSVYGETIELHVIGHWAIRP